MKVSWPFDNTTLEACLIALGFSKSSLKKAGLKRQTLNRIIRNHAVIDIPESLFNKGEVFPLYKGLLPPQIIEEKNDILALSKPSGVHCHPLKYNEGDNLLSYLRERSYFSYLDTNRGHYDRGLLYRLDYETSGLCLFTSNQEFYDDFRVNHHLAKKFYLAIVDGEYCSEMELVDKLSTSGKKIGIDPSGKEARLIIHDIDSSKLPGKSILKVELIGGLRHQIRVQLANSGYPLIGDTLYGGKEHEHFGLHCYEYQWRGEHFTDTTLDVSVFL